MVPIRGQLTAFILLFDFPRQMRTDLLSINNILGTNQAPER
jgi:hypothetical protein